MNFLMVSAAFCLLSTSVCSGQAGDDRLKTVNSEWRSRYEYKYSFKGPRLSVSGETIPFWNITGGKYDQ